MASPTYLPGPNREAAASRVAAPAIAIVVVSGLAIAGGLLNMLLQVLGLGAGMFGRGGDEARFAQLMGSTIGVVVTLIGLVLYGVAIFGALKMKALRSWGIDGLGRDRHAALLVLLPDRPAGGHLGARRAAERRGQVGLLLRRGRVAPAPVGPAEAAQRVARGAARYGCSSRASSR